MQIESLKYEKNSLLDKNAHLQQILNGERVCDAYCLNCIHNLDEKRTTVLYKSNGITYSQTTVKCALDCRCPNFERREKDQ